MLSLTGIKGLSTHPSQHARFAVSADGQLSIAFDAPLLHPVRVAVFATSGVKMMDADISEGVQQTNLSLGHLPKGVYAVQLTTEDVMVNGSTLIRR